MMTTICEMIMECRAIKGMDKLVLFGWATQLEEGNDTLYCSKETVAESIGVSDDTVLRRTQALIKAGWLIDTGEQKQWAFGWTPVRIINVPVIMGLVDAQCRKLRRVAECTPPQNAAQGSRSSGLSSSPSFTTTTATGVPPVVVSGRSKEVKRTEDLKPAEPEPKPKPTPHGQRTCPKCDEPWSRHGNHICKGIAAQSKPMEEEMEFEDWDYDCEPLFPKIESGEARRRVEAERQRSAANLGRDVRATPTPTALDNSPRSAAPPIYLCMLCEKAPCRSPTSDHCVGCWNNGKPIGKIPAGAVPKVFDAGINP
jgi:hypothetical protein